MFFHGSFFDRAKYPIFMEGNNLRDSLGCLIFYCLHMNLNKNFYEVKYVEVENNYTAYINPRPNQDRCQTIYLNYQYLSEDIRGISTNDYREGERFITLDRTLK